MRYLDHPGIAIDTWRYTFNLCILYYKYTPVVKLRNRLIPPYLAGETATPVSKYEMRF